MKPNRGRLPLAVAAGGAVVVLLAAAILLVHATAPRAHDPAPARHRTSIATPSPTPSLPPDLQAIVGQVSTPVRLVIPALGVNATVEDVGIGSGGQMGTPTQVDDVGWYQLGVRPGASGDAIIDGHLDWYDNPCTVFCHLASLRPGDVVKVDRADGTQVSFSVDSLKTYPYDATPPSFFAQYGPPQLSLVTCAGSWDEGKATYTQRLVVHADLMPGSVTSTPGDEAG